MLHAMIFTNDLIICWLNNSLFVEFIAGQFTYWVINVFIDKF